MFYRIANYIILFVLCCHYFAFSQDINKIRGITLVESTDDYVIIKFEPQRWSHYAMSINGQDYLKYDFFYASFNNKAGEPLLPVMRINLGVPLDAEISYSIVEASFVEISGKLLPQFQIMPENNISQYQFLIDPIIYSRSEWYPAAIVEANEPEYFRDQRTVTVSFCPLQTFPAADKIRRYDSIIARFDFKGSKQLATETIGRPAEEDLYQTTILNYERAKKWRQASASILQKVENSNAGDTWLKMYVKDEGIYKITGSMLVNYGIDIKLIDPATIKVFNNGGRELDRSISATPVDSLIENPILIYDGGDGIFDILDYFLFYGKPVADWQYYSDQRQYEHYINHYGDVNVYWLTWGGYRKGKRMQSLAVSVGAAITPETSFLSPYFFEQEINNFLNSGYEWYSRLFVSGDSYTFTINLPYARPQDTIFKFNFVGWTSSVRHNFKIYVNNTKIDDYYTSTGIGVSRRTLTKSGVIKSGYNDIRIEYSSTNSSSQAYLDWFEIQYQRDFIASNDQLLLYLPPTPDIKSYSVSGFTNNDIYVFDISDFKNVKRISNTTIANNEISFIDSAHVQKARKMIVSAATAFKTPERMEEAEFGTLRNLKDQADFIIITHEDFYNTALRFARHRETQDSIKTMVVTTSKIYDDFSFGLFDPTAIRDFIKYVYNRWNPKPMYVLLFGDGDYDYKNIISTQDKNWVPTYQTSELDINNNRTMDDWFVCVSGNDTKPELAIGRLPVRSVEEAQIMVDKIIVYETVSFLDENSRYGIDDWRNVVTMVGDDELVGGGVGNETIHTTDAENIIEDNFYVPNKFNKVKIYLSEYPEVRGMSFLSAVLKPAAADAIMNQINKGTLILNYVGHGNPSTWSHEYVLYAPRDFNKIQNSSRLAFWIAATCDFGRFDDPSHQGLAESLLTSPVKGAIGILASTRLAYASENAAINRAFLFHLFRNQKTSERLGTALLKAKLDRGNRENDQKYTLLGDPTMRLASPEYQAAITSIQPDTMKALSKVAIAGSTDLLPSQADVKVLLKAFDSKKKKSYVTKQGSTMNYVLSGNTIFRGIGTLQDGKFEINYIVPKDITYGGDLGRISVYMVGDKFSGSGYRDSLMVGGTSEIIDNQGPEIKISLQDQKFFTGGFASETPLIKVEIGDSISGVNITGDIGHNITMMINDDEENKVILTDLFQYREGSYTEGIILYDFRDYKGSSSLNNTNTQQAGLPEGTNRLLIKAWDNSNNSSTAYTEFIVVSSSKLELHNVLNYPNPFSDRTTISFWSNHDSWIKIKIYTVAGRMIYQFDEFPLNINELAQVNWDGRDADGDVVGNGVYFYKVIAKAQINGKTETKETIQKLVVMR